MNKSYRLIALLSALLVGAFINADAQVSVVPNSIVSAVSDDYLQKLITAAKTNYPHVKENAHRMNAAKANLDKARVSWFESFTFSYVYQPYQLNTVNYSDPAHTYFNGLQVGVFFNLGNFLERPSTIRQAREELYQTSNQQQEYLINLELNVKTNYYTYLQRLASLKNFNQAVLDAGNLAQDVRHKYQKGEDTFENYSRAQVTLSQENELRLQAETNLLIAKAALEALVGDKLENIK